MKKNLLVAAMLAQPWALMPEYMQSMASVVARWQAGVEASPETLAAVHADMEARQAARAQAQARAGGGSIAVINVFGVLTQRGNMMDEISGGGSCSTEQLVAQLRSAEVDDTIGQILLNFSTPGGSVYGIQEAAAEINRIKASKPIIGISNSMCASAGYWLAAQCTELYCTPGGEVGSIGVWQAHEDMSQALEEAGVKISLISAGKFKVEGNPYEPLGDEARAFMQLRTDEYYDPFAKAVAKGRGVGVDAVRNGMGQGRVLGAPAALAENMIDGIATFDEVVKKMQRAAKGSKGASAEIEPGRILSEAESEAAITTLLDSSPLSQSESQVPSRLSAMQRELEILSI
ncbi:S49 family peptidase [Rhodoferax sp. GW822-FHT02A01]|uniref:S49 family peptidase n=1 Tax=Rhodoferax sp. GW822-FHT02A01 TaxID=3141537 RepID=UPI00315D0B49